MNKSKALRYITVVCIACVAVTSIIWMALSSQDWAAIGENAKKALDGGNKDGETDA